MSYHDEISHCILCGSSYSYQGLNGWSLRCGACRNDNYQLSPAFAVQYDVNGRWPDACEEWTVGCARCPEFFRKGISYCCTGCQNDNHFEKVLRAYRLESDFVSNCVVCDDDILNEAQYDVSEFAQDDASSAVCLSEFAQHDCLGSLSLRGEECDMQ